MAKSQNIKPLTTKTIESMRAKDADKSDVAEYKGLRVSCGVSGIKTFYYRYTSPLTGKLTQIKIGIFPNISLVQAREKVAELKLIRAQGRCPATEKREAEKERLLNEKQERQADAVFTIEALIELYLTQYIEDRKLPNGKIVEGARNPKGQAETRRTLEADIVKPWRDRVASEVTRKQIVDQIMSIVDRGANVQAGNVLRELSSAYEFAIGLGKFDEQFANPALLAKSSLRKTRIRLTSERGKRVLSDIELKKLFAWLPHAKFSQTLKNVMYLALWTGCRTGEICNMEWDDVDFNKRTIHLKQTKTATERYVQLPQQAVDFLKILKLSSGKYLFASSVTGQPIQQKYLTENTWHLRRKGEMLDIPNWTPHDLRRTVRTGLSKLRCPNEVAEAIIGHARSGIEGTYDLHSYSDECREWLQK